MLKIENKGSGLLRRRAELINNTSLEIFRQKKISELSRIKGQIFAKQFESFALNEVLCDQSTFAVVLKCVDVDNSWAVFLKGVKEKNLQLSMVLPITNVRALYASLAVEERLTWLFPYLVSSSTYLVSVDDRDNYLEFVKYCISNEVKMGDVFFEVLFIKEANRFIDFSLVNNTRGALELRKLYSSKNLNSILLELSVCIATVPATLSGIFSVSLVGAMDAIYFAK